MLLDKLLTNDNLMTPEQRKQWLEKRDARLESYKLIPKLENPYVLGVSGVFDEDDIVT